MVVTLYWRPVVGLVAAAAAAVAAETNASANGTMNATNATSAPATTVWLPREPSGSSSTSTSSSTANYAAKWRTACHAALQTIVPGRRIELELATRAPSVAQLMEPVATTTTTAAAAAVPPPPRYVLTIIDHQRPATTSTSPSLASCAILIIPQGRETEYLFAHPRGQASLCAQHRFHRLTLVTLHRSHTFTGGTLQAVQDELKPHMSLLTPMNAREPVPIMSLAADLGERRPVAQVDSTHNGLIVVEDVKIDDEWIRRLVFAQHNLVQSEARLLSAPSPSSSSSKKKQQQAAAAATPVALDVAFLPCAYQHAMVTSLCFLDRIPQRMLHIGLGGGNIPQFLHHLYPHLDLEVVEIDADIKRLSEQHFAFVEHPGRLTCTLADGCAVLHDRHAAILRSSAASSASSQYDCIMVDCNSLDLREGMSFPPAAFLQPDTLTAIRGLLRPGAAFILNFGCRDPVLRAQKLRDMYWYVAMGGGGGGGDDNNAAAGAMFEMAVDDEDVNTAITIRVAPVPPEVSDAEALATHMLTRGRMNRLRRALLQQREEASANSNAARPSATFDWRADMNMIHRLALTRTLVPVDPHVRTCEEMRLDDRPLPTASASVVDSGDDDDNNASSALHRRRRIASVRRWLRLDDKDSDGDNGGDADADDSSWHDLDDAFPSEQEEREAIEAEKTTTKNDAQGGGSSATANDDDAVERKRAKARAKKKKQKERAKQQKQQQQGQQGQQGASNDGGDDDEGDGEDA